ncbi:hypothetical protein PRO82_001884 [Candidatus Protochlamydia amoebophila]|nr:hypothetical protein [Candidatus Protochlamydia amoebophila]
MSNIKIGIFKVIDATIEKRRNRALKKNNKEKEKSILKCCPPEK